MDIMDIAIAKALSGSGGGGGGGASTVIVNLTYDSDTDKWISDKTIDEVIGSVPNIVAYMNIDGVNYVYPLADFSTEASYTYVAFSKVGLSDPTQVMEDFYILSAEGVEFFQNTYPR